MNDFQICYFGIFTGVDVKQSSPIHEPKPTPAVAPQAQAQPEPIVAPAEEVSSGTLTPAYVLSVVMSLPGPAQHGTAAHVMMGLWGAWVGVAWHCFSLLCGTWA